MFPIQKPTSCCLSIRPAARHCIWKTTSTKKCYEVLQGKTSPCEFCTNDRLCDDNFYTWEFTNPSIGRHFLLKDKIIQWRGKTARMEIAFDITERELQKQELKNMLDVQTLITNCVRMLYAVDDLDQTINAVLT